jgi:hypothetical protein
MADDFQKRMRIEHALRERDIRIACLILESLRHGIELTREQSPTVLEALIDYAKEYQKPDDKKLRVALIEYAEETLREARKMERMLYHGITGRPETDETDK